MNKFPVIWLTGLAGSGKSTIARALYDRLQQQYKNILYLDGDEARILMNDVRGYTRKDRIIVTKKRIGLIEFLNNQNMIVIASAISMFNEIYEYNRNIFKDMFFEIYIKCDMEELISRNQKGLYSGAFSGKVKNVVGVDIQYDEPTSHLILDNSKKGDLDTKVDLIIEKLQELYFI